MRAIRGKADHAIGGISMTTRYEVYVAWAKRIGKKDIMSREEFMYELWMGNSPPLASAPDG